jgi:hypothetical protein
MTRRCLRRRVIVNALVEQARAQTLPLKNTLGRPTAVHDQDVTGMSSSPLLIEDCGVEGATVRDGTLVACRSFTVVGLRCLDFASAGDNCPFAACLAF